MDSNLKMQERLEKINNINNFLKEVDKKVKSISDELNWDFNKLCQQKEPEPDLSVCSVDPNHRLPSSAVVEHIEKCRWAKAGYLPTDMPFPHYSGHGSCIVMTPELQTSIIGNAACSTEKFQLGCNSVERPVPQTAIRLEQDFTTDERRAIYDYVVAHTQGGTKIVDINFLNVEEKSQKKEMTALELAAAERDAKRRRASYRNKVHTNRKTQTEILREVIESQMECLKEELPVREDWKPRKHEFRQKKHDDHSGHSREDGFVKDRIDHKRNKHKHKSRDREISSRHKKDSKKDRSSSRSKHKKHKKSTSRSRSREKYRKSHEGRSHSSSNSNRY